MKFENKDEVLAHSSAHAKVDTQYDVAETKIAVIPFRDTGTSAFRRVAAYIERITHVRDSKAHTMVLAYDGDKWYHWCGDSFLGGKYTAAERNEALKVARDASETAVMRDLFGKFSDSACGFWSRGGGRCKHTDNLHSNISEDVLDEIEQLYHGASTTAQKRKRRTPEQFIEKRLFKKHVKLEGPKGWGKTYLARMVAAKHADLVINIAGSEKIDSAGLEGHLVPHAERITSRGQGGLFETNEQIVQTFVFKYGALARAFRAAAAGKKVIVVIDELYRIPPQQMQLLVTALAPTDGHYILPVSNMIESQHEWEDGLVEEEICAPVGNLMVISTTNVGARYIIDGIDEALQDRFHTIQVLEDRDLMDMVLGKALGTRALAPHHKQKLISFYDGVKRLELDKKLTREINLRHLVEIVETSVDDNDIAETAIEMHTQWCSLNVDGLYDPLQQQLIEALANSKLAS